MESPETIFVSIPSYRDSECQHTIKNLLAKAAKPERVYVGVCFQYDEEADKDCLQHWPEETFPGQIAVKYVNYKDATGPCWARYLCQQFYTDQKYFFSIDSHMRFIQDWDEVLINLLAQCPSKKPILTTYPPGYELPDKLQNPVRPIVTCAKELGADGMLRFVGKELKSPPKAPLPALFWVSGFSFSSAKVIQEVPYDPHLPFLFFGEESSMTVRLWTAGWDFYAPPVTILYHLWERTHRPSFRENKDPSEIEKRSQSRIRYLLGMVDSVEPEALVEIEKYGNGTVRTLQEYQKHSGVDFQRAQISETAKYGGQPKDIFMEDILNMLMMLASSLK